MTSADGRSTRFCTQCGQVIRFEDRFCPECGSDQSTPSRDPGERSHSVATENPSIPPSGSSAEMSTHERPSSPKRLGVVVVLVVVLILIAAGSAIGVIELTGPSSTHRGSSSLHGSGSPPRHSSKSYISFAAEYAAVKTAIVKITTIGCDGNGYEGSGFVIDAHDIVTAAHVVEGSESMSVTVNGSPTPAQIIGLDESGDVALLHTDEALSPSYIPLEVHDPLVGQSVAALGYPLNGGLTMTIGSVSALNQSITVSTTNLGGLVQTDTPINHGNSGGPLVALDGHADGIVDALNPNANATGYAIGPDYARAEIDNWISAPESHPLPLCTSPNPLGSISAMPSPTPPSVPSSGPGVPIPTVPLTSEGTSAMEIVQSLANALASHQWDQARSILPSLGPDSQLANDYGGLDASTVVVTSESDSGSQVTLTGGYVAWETVSGQERTSIYCIRWGVDLGAQVVQSQSSIDSNLVAFDSQWNDPSTLVPTVTGQCVP